MLENMSITGITPLEYYPNLNCLTSCKQILQTETVCIPCHKPDVEDIDEIKVSILIDKFQIIDTILGPKVLISGCKKIKVIYTACIEETLHSSHWSIPFQEFILLEGICYYDALEILDSIFVGIEHIEVICFDTRCIGLSLLFILCPKLNTNCCIPYPPCPIPIYITGPPGPPGPVGPTGPTGADGMHGVTGATGAIGPTGADGMHGVTGATGAIGPTGADGMHGATGATGAIGPTGADGMHGATGAIGPTGATGVTGITGLSAYEIWINRGNTGDEGDFLESLRGDSGIDGIDGIDGCTGCTGFSAYEIWINNGYTGNEGDFLESLRGEDGIDGVDGCTGPNGMDGIAGPTGATGPTGKKICTTICDCGCCNLYRPKNCASKECTSKSNEDKKSKNTYKSKVLNKRNKTTYEGSYSKDNFNYYNNEIIYFNPPKNKKR